MPRMLQLGAVFGLALLLWAIQIEWDRRRQGSGGVVVVDVIDGKLCPVHVFDHPELNIRFMRCNGTILGGVHLSSGESAFRAFVIMSAIVYTRPEGNRALAVGLGAGSLHRNLQHQGIIVDNVEIEPAVVQAAQQHFQWKPNGFVALEDAYEFLERQSFASSHAVYDYVIVDVFTARRRSISRLYTTDSIQRLKSLLKPGATMAMNLVTFVGRNPLGEYPRISSLMYNTLKQSFKYVRCFIDNDASNTPANEAFNLVCFTSDSPITFQLPEPNRLGQHSYTQDDVIQRFQSWEIKFKGNTGEIFTSETQFLIDAEDESVHHNIDQQITASIS